MGSMKPESNVVPFPSPRDLEHESERGGGGGSPIEIRLRIVLELPEDEQSRPSVAEPAAKPGGFWTGVLLALAVTLLL